MNKWRMNPTPPDSFIREYVLDNIYVCSLAYILFYIALWYANKVIERIEKINEEMMETVAENRTKLDDIIALKNKRREYEEVVMKAKGAQRLIAKQLEDEIEKMNDEVTITKDKLTGLEKILRIRTSGTQYREREVINFIQEGECTKDTRDFVADSVEDIQILTPTIPPNVPRKYGISVPRPIKGRSSPPRIGFK
ncbi:hypothetical protein PV325_004857 [Microctonus aethiopoides]|nr:hypothetical protein PV325_004857 [Microctonus aethiopoides]